MIAISCSSCEKSFRVRPEFAGRSTRCPRCGSPMQIARTEASPRVSQVSPPELPSKKSAPAVSSISVESRPDTAKEWKSLAGAMGREQVAVLFASGTLLMILLFAACSVAEFFRGSDFTLQLLMLLATTIPALIALAFGGIARIMAMNVPSGYYAKPVAWLGLLGIGGIVFSVLLLFLSMTTSDRYFEEMGVSVFGLGTILCLILSTSTILILVIQMGIALGSKEMSKALGQFGLTVGVSFLVIFGMIFLVAGFVILFEGGGRGSYYGYGYRRNPLEVLVRVLIVLPLPILFAITLIAYYRLLGVCRKTLLARVKGVYDER